ncbi:MAG: synthase subunit [Nitrospirae bacterium]|nr:synthase subunit [Nitrospirota bacterium]
MPEAIRHLLPYIVIVNFALVALVLVALAFMTTRRALTEVPDGLQNAAEFVLEWFVRLARDMRPDGVPVIAPFLASLFLFILFSNLLSILAFPVINIPPTAYYSGPLTLALIAMVGITVLSSRFKGIAGSLKHLFWPNPLQIISQIGDTLSLSLRLFGNIGGEFLVVLLVTKAAPYGIPLVIHALGLIPAFIQPMVFTLLTANFLAEAVHGEKKGPHTINRQELSTVGPPSSEPARTGT